MSALHSGRVSKGQRRIKRRVLRRMAIMTDSNENEREREEKQFLETGRTGRRNALPDILSDQDASVTTADLPARLEQLATDDPANPQPSTSKTNVNPQNPDPPPTAEGS